MLDLFEKTLIPNCSNKLEVVFSTLAMEDWGQVFHREDRESKQGNYLIGCSLTLHYLGKPVGCL